MSLTACFLFVTISFLVYRQSSSLANANSYGQYQGPGEWCIGFFVWFIFKSVCVIFEGGFGSSAGIAGAQGFQSHGPMGGNNY